ncbi:hypothetical protein Hanom_Chr14g01291421 [Helianthus anomalus]
MEVAKGTLKPHPMHENRAFRQLFQRYSKCSTGRAQPNTPRAQVLQKKVLVLVTGHGPCSLTRPVASLLLKYDTSNLTTGPWPDTQLRET